MQRSAGVAWGGVAVMAAAVIAIVGGLALALGGRDDPQEPAQPPPAPALNAATTAAPADPYETFLQLAPPDAPKLTRDEAQARAVLGCGQQWAPGTTDAALAQAYGHLCP